MTPDELKFWLAFSQITKIGPQRWQKLINNFPSISEAWRANFNDLIQAGIERNLVEEIVIRRKDINPDQELEKLTAEDIKVITIKNKNYPKLLKEIYNPPALLYYKGNFSLTDEFTLAIVGTRKLTNYGKQVAIEVTSQLASQGLIIVSGLALGIDSVVHDATIKANGRTIAVLGSGVDQQSIYPATNRFLAQRIIENNGAVISEFPIGTIPMKHHFPFRNRIIAGLSLGTLVIEAAESSGALITAKHALDQNRDVFAVPGSIYNLTSVGPNNLIKMGAKAINTAQDILDALNLTDLTKVIANKKIIPSTPEEKVILKILSQEPLNIDKIVQQSKLNASAVSSTLTMMEMTGKIRHLGGSNYVLAR